MPVQFYQGDIFFAQGVNAFAHGCNCAGAMGKGIALNFRKKWPRMYERYRVLCREGAFRLGSVFMWEDEGNTIFNLGTQESWRTRADLSAIKISFAKMMLMAEEKQLKKIAMPRIGAGLGGGDWEAIKDCIIDIGEKTDIHIMVCELYINNTSLQLIESDKIS